MSTSSIFNLGLDTQKLLNAEFEDWTAGSPDLWSVAGTVSEELSVVFSGAKSIKMSGAVSVIQDVYISVANESRKLRFTCWVKSSTPSAVRIHLDDGSLVYSSYHTGSGVWEELSVEKTLNIDVSVELGIDNSSSDSYADCAWAGLWSIDESFMIDKQDDSVFDIESETSVDPAGGYMRVKETRDFDIICDVDIVLDYVKQLDLMPLIPETFHAVRTEGEIDGSEAKKSYILEDFVYEIGRYVGAWVTKVDELVYLQDPYSVQREYCQYLASMIGLQLVITDDTPIEDLQNQISQAVDWYKIKGTYESLSIISYLSGFIINIYDMYTNDYVTFIKEPWFVGDEGENPPGLDSSYYKSPHFSFEIVLDRKYMDGSLEYLWQDAQFTSIQQSVEAVRPVNAVCHYGVLLNPITDESRSCITTTEGIITTITIDWPPSALTIDQVGSGIAWDLDDGRRLDRSSTFLPTVTKFKIGTGNAGVSPCTSGFTLSNVVYSCDVLSYTEYPDRVEFEVLIPSTEVFSGCTELGLFLNDNTTMVVASTFPWTDKTLGMEIRILVTVMIGTI